MLKNLAINLIAALIVALPFALVFYFFLSDGEPFLPTYLYCAGLALLCEYARKAITRLFDSKKQ